MRASSSAWIASSPRRLPSPRSRLPTRRGSCRSSRRSRRRRRARRRRSCRCSSRCPSRVCTRPGGSRSPRSRSSTPAPTSTTRCGSPGWPSAVTRVAGKAVLRRPRSATRCTGCSSSLISPRPCRPTSSRCAAGTRGSPTRSSSGCAPWSPRTATRRPRGMLPR